MEEYDVPNVLCKSINKLLSARGGDDDAGAHFKRYLQKPREKR